jgi:hypothetical protein
VPTLGAAERRSDARFGAGSLEATLIVLVLRPDDPAAPSTLLLMLVAPSPIIFLVTLFSE